MSLEQLMALVPLESASNVREQGRRTRWDKKSARYASETSKFGNPDDRPFLPPPFVDVPPGLNSYELDLFLKEQRYGELSAKLSSGELEWGDPDIRSPSPPPTYDKNGARTNTRDVRIRNAMVAEYHRLIDYIITHVPGFQPPSDYKPVKKVKRIEIPLEKYPEYNFMGLIIGPRGCNHKRLETESGTQISVRGRGTQKGGKKYDHQTEEEASMPMHVHIAADNEEKLAKAVSLIEPLLDPFHPMHEEFKKKGLEQLALVNGYTMNKTEQRCTLCSAVGHYAYECPDNQELQSFKKPQVKCALCGDEGHVTMDCRMAQGLPISQGRFMPNGIPDPVNMQQMEDKRKMDFEYQKMMSELSGSKSGDNMDTLDEPEGAVKTQTMPLPPGIQPGNTPFPMPNMHMAGAPYMMQPEQLTGNKPKFGIGYHPQPMGGAWQAQQVSAQMGYRPTMPYAMYVQAQGGMQSYNQTGASIPYPNNSLYAPGAPGAGNSDASVANGMPNPDLYQQQVMQHYNAGQVPPNYAPMYPVMPYPVAQHQPSDSTGAPADDDSMDMSS